MLGPADDEDELRGIARPPSMDDAVPSTAVRALPPPMMTASPAPTAGSTEDLEGKGLATHLAPHIAAPTTTAEPRGLRPQPGDFQPEKMPLWEKILSPLAIGAAAYHNPQEGARLMDAFYQAPKREAQEKYETASKAYEQQTEDERKAAEDAAKANPKMGLTPEETTIHDLMAGDNGQPRVNPQTGKPYSYLEAYQAVSQAKQDVKPDKEAKTDKVTRVVNGKLHTILIDGVTGKDIKDEGETKLPGESPGEKRSASEIAQVEREARGNVRKAEGQYRATQQSVQQLQSGIDAAKDGNGLLTSFVPTMEVLGINASNGVHRISPAEAQAAGMPGGFVERFNAWFDKASTNKLSPQLQAEGKALGKILADSAYQRYKSTYEDESGIVEGYGGKDFGKHVPLIKHEGGEAENRGGNQFSISAGGQTFNFKDQKSLDEFKKEAGIQ